MNSHQRRQDRRRWRYRVQQKIAPEDITSWRKVYAEYRLRFVWCCEQWGNVASRCGWRYRDHGQIWEFDCSKKAVLFALRWG